MEFTGERVVPGKVEPDLWNEHLSRYYFARPVAEGRRVLDVGCGTGYGAAWVARWANKVVALDLSMESVAFAKKNYPAQNLEFLVSDCRKIALAPQTVDTALCFEVIEHLAEQEALLEEIKRVLRPEGVLVISTPNRIYYTEERNERNPFHVRECDIDQFRTLLQGSFANVELAFQNHVASLYIGDPRQARPLRAEMERGGGDLERTAHYFVAVCSNAPLASRSAEPIIYLPASGNLLRERDQQIKILEERIRTLDRKILEQQREYDSQSRWCLQLGQQMQERMEWAQRLEARIQELDARIEELQHQHRGLEEELQKRAEWAKGLNLEVAERAQRLTQLQAEFDERTAWALQLNEELKVSRGKLERIKQSKLFQISRALGLAPKE
ncbi:MAG: methyltransferase domain-containing protein [Acidimicrobiia bacterium]|nr:methyltransferase domain-containing protein [Acidimicrobiia bacterium]